MLLALFCHALASLFIWLGILLFARLSVLLFVPNRPQAIICSLFNPKVFLVSVLLSHLQQQLDSFSAQQTVSRWLLAFSGGLDSTVLLHALAQLQASVPIAALHINHQLSAQADDWQQSAQQFAQLQAVEFMAERVEVVESGRGLEDAARQARYRVFERHLDSHDVLLMAHHADDQAETMLLRLLRGAGPEGLAGIRASRTVGAGCLFRPLLGLTRAQLQDYACEHRLSWVEDDSNSDMRFDRNFLRHEVLPQLKQRWPRFQSRWQQAAEHCNTAAKQLQKMSANRLQGCDLRAERWGQSLSLGSLAALSQVDRFSVLRLWLQRLGVNPELAQLQQVECQMVVGRADAVAEVRIGPNSLRRFNERLYATDVLPLETIPAAVLPFDEESNRLNLPLGTLTLEAGGVFSQERLQGRQLSVRFRSGGERCKPAGRAHSQSLKKLLQEYRLEPWLRPYVPLIYVDEQLAAVAGLWLCAEFADTNTTDEALRWQLPDSCAGALLVPVE